MKIKVIGKKRQLIAGFVEDEEYCIFSTGEAEYVSVPDLLFNSTDENGYFKSKSTGEEFISLSLEINGMSKSAALNYLTK